MTSAQAGSFADAAGSIDTVDEHPVSVAAAVNATVAMASAERTGRRRGTPPGYLRGGDDQPR